MTTDEEERQRQLLVHKLRRIEESEKGDWLICAEAADEIEELAQEIELLRHQLVAAASLDVRHD